MARWRQFLRDEPLPADRGEIVAAVHMALVANIHRAKNAQPIQPIEFMPFLGPAWEREQVERARRRLMPDPVDEEDAILQRLVIGAGGQIG